VAVEQVPGDAGALEVDGLTHAFGSNRVLTGVYLSVHPGEIVGIVGRNGCGKTTMLRAIYGVLHADSVHVRIAGEVVEKAFRTGAVSYLFQEPFFPRRLSVAGAVRGLLSAEGARTVLEDPRAAPLAKQRVGALSGGELRYLEVLAVLAKPSQFVFLDEPFTEIEPVHREPMKEAIREAARARGRGIVMTDHAYRDVLDTADRVLVLADGVLRPVVGESDLRRWGYTP
jgi:ABC-type multidrug transport system ATPase subunit